MSELLEKLKLYGVGRRKMNDVFFAGDKLPPRLGIYDVDDENLCHEIIITTCHIPACSFKADSLLDFENHYNAAHRYSCSQCKKVLPSPHLLDLHIQENHDSFFAVVATKKPSYSCYIEDCKEKFLNTEERLEHCVKYHKLPKDFRFDQKPKVTKVNKHKSKKKNKECNENFMDSDNIIQSEKKFTFSNNKQKSFTKYTGRIFTTDSGSTSTRDVNMDDIAEELKDSLS